VDVANTSTLSRILKEERDRALLFRTLATLRTDVALFGNVDELEWKGPASDFPVLAARLDSAKTSQSPARRSATP
jgi:hypothetical protein